ncbi:nucleoside kinase [Devosia sp. Root635]|uniref:nucleoside kinase n=1 Tax=Devosia sp. Root635 TaxID=1736575 RepID=UPI0006FD4E56|nr:nucleoside kinase [Devosia sp. Root635]KRA42599.1 nucleoside kinase [Devosia sp. Root635]
MAICNYLVEGSSGAGKTTVATELERRGYHVVHGDRVLAYQGDPETGARLFPPAGDHQFISDHHIWDLDQVRAIIADKTRDKTFFCGGSRNWHKFIHRMDAVFLLELDRETLERRIDSRVDEWGSEAAERAIIMALHETRKYQPEDGIRIDAARPLAEVVDAILAHCR